MQQIVIRSNPFKSNPALPDPLFPYPSTLINSYLICSPGKLCPPILLDRLTWPKPNIQGQIIYTPTTPPPHHTRFCSALGIVIWYDTRYEACRHGMNGLLTFAYIYRCRKLSYAFDPLNSSQPNNSSIITVKSNPRPLNSKSLQSRDCPSKISSLRIQSFIHPLILSFNNHLSETSYHRPT